MSDQGKNLQDKHNTGEKYQSQNVGKGFVDIAINQILGTPGRSGSSEEKGAFDKGAHNTSEQQKGKR